MLVELGNAVPLNADGTRAVLNGPSVTYINIPDSYTMEPGANAQEFRAHIADAILDRDGITHMPDHEAAMAVVHPGGVWRTHGADRPTWVWSDHDELQRFLADYWGVPVGRPDDIEDSHNTMSGPPGVVPGAIIDLEANITQTGRDMWAKSNGGGAIGATGTTTAVTATSLADSSKAFTVNAFQGQRVVAGGVWANIITNTATTLTLDRWYNPANPGAAAGSTPTSPIVYVILDSNAPAWFVGLTANNTAPASPSTATSLTGEIVTAGGGLVRLIAPWAHTAGTNTYTLTPVWTANGSDALPVTAAKIGVFNSMVVGSTPNMQFETLLSVAATLSTSGDQLTVTETVTGT